MSVRSIALGGLFISIAALVSNVIWHALLNWTSLAIAANVAAFLLIYFKDLRFLAELGVLTRTKSVSRGITGHTIREQLRHSHTVEQELRRALTSIEDIGREAFADTLREIKDDEIRESLASTHGKIVQIRQKEIEGNWITQGLAAISGIKQKGNDLAEYGYLVLSGMIKYLGANQGGFFLLDNTKGDEHFELIASYAYDKRKYIERRVNPGEGLIGQMYYQQEVILLTDVPNDFVRITSGLGEALPRCICMLPLLSEGKIHGVIELASFRKFEPFEVDFLMKVGAQVGYNLSAIENSRKTEDLLNASQQMASEVKAQEEELRQNIEELRSTQETMMRERTQLETLSLVADSTHNSVIITDRNGLITYVNEGFTRLTGYSFDEIQGRKPGSFLQGPLTDKQVIANISSRLRTGEALYEEILNYKKNGDAYWVSMVINPVKGTDGVIEKYVSVQADITETKKLSLDFQAKLESIGRTNVIIEFNARGEVLKVNEFFFRIMEFATEDIIARPYVVMIPAEDRAKPQTQMMWESIFAGQSFTGEFRLADKRGKIQWLSGSYNPVFNINGELEKILMLGQFVTADRQKMMELQQVIAAIDACVPTLELNHDLTFRTANQAFLSEAGLRRLELKKLSPVAVFGDTVCQQLSAFIKDAASTSQVFEAALRLGEGNMPCYKGRLFKLNENSDTHSKVLLVLNRG